MVRSVSIRLNHPRRRRDGQTGAVAITQHERPERPEGQDLRGKE